MAIKLLGEGLKQSDVARRLQVNKSQISRWLSTYRKSGLTGLQCSPSGGRPPKNIPESTLSISDEIKIEEIYKKIAKIQRSDVPIESFSDLFKKIMDEKNISSSIVCQRAGVDNQTYERILSNDIHNPHRCNIIRVILALNPEPEELNELLSLARISLMDEGEEGLIKQFYKELPNIRQHDEKHRKCDLTDLFNDDHFQEQFDKYFIDFSE